MAAVARFIGRASDCDAALSALRVGHHVLITGRAGIGKTALLQEVFRRYAAEVGARVCLVWVPLSTTKNAFLAIAEALHQAFGLTLPAALLPAQTLRRAKRQGFLPWPEVQRAVRRLPVAELAALLVASLRGRPVVVFLAGLEVPPSQAEFYQRLFDAAQIVAAVTSHHRRPLSKALLWRFQVRLELAPLTLDESRRLAARWLSESSLQFSDGATRERFIQAVARAAQGIPAALLGMIEAQGEEVITPTTVDRLPDHEAATVYWDMTPLVLLSLVGFIALRYLGQGLSDTELWVLAGLGSTLLVAGRLVYGWLKLR